MKKNILIVAVIAVVIIAVIVIASLGEKDESNKEEGTNKVSVNEEVLENIDFSTATEAEEFINKVYEKLGDNVPNLITTTIDITDTDALSYNTGLTDSQGIEYVVISEPAMSAQAYSLVLIKVSEDTDIENIKQEVFRNVDTRKWICVEAENKYAINYDNTIIFFMAAKEWATPVYDTIKSFLGNNIGYELKEER